MIIEGERLIVDIDFRSEFAIARPTKAYKLILQTLPGIFIGKSDRLEKIIGIVSDAAKQSLKKKGMPVPPWRKPGYIKSKWLSPSTTRIAASLITSPESQLKSEGEKAPPIAEKIPSYPGEKLYSPPDKGEPIFVLSNSNSSSSCDATATAAAATPQPKKWELPQIRPKNPNKGVKIVTGLASVIDNKP